MNDFMKQQVGKYFVARTYSHTNHKQLWRILSRPLMDFLTADVMLEGAKADCPKGQEAFIVRVVDTADSEYAISRRVNNAWHEGYKAAIQSVLEGRHCKGGLSPYVPLDKSKL